MINGFAAEHLFSSLIATSHKIKPFKLPNSETLIAVARSSQLGQERLRKAEPYLKKQFGTPYRNPTTQRLEIQFNWLDIPPAIILDYVYGIDIVVTILGWTVGIDITSNQEEIDHKQWKLQQLKDCLWQKIGIDKTAICYIQNHHQKTSSDDLFRLFKSISQAKTSVVPITVTV